MRTQKNIPFRVPMMLRGYYIRTFIMRDIVRRFMEHNDNYGNNKRQIVNLGAGFDTLYWWLKENKLVLDENNESNIKYYELDFLPVLQRKLASLSGSNELLQQIGKEENIIFDVKAGKLQSPEYFILPTDLRDIELVKSNLLENGFDVTSVKEKISIFQGMKLII